MTEDDVFVLDEQGTEEAIVSGEQVEAYDSAYGWNDDLVNWLNEAGFWDILTSMEPDKRANGIKASILNGVWVVMDLAHIGKIQEVDPVLRDGRIMHEVGFGIHKVRASLRHGQGVIHRDTLRNHIKRVSVREATRVFYEHVTHMRRKKLIRGRIYGADGFDIEVSSPDSYEGCGKRWDPDKGRWLYGYKAVLLFNLSDVRPRIIGLALGPINTDERDLLLEILSSLSCHVAPVSQIIDTLVLDRGYWGVGFFRHLGEKYSLHIVTPGKAKLDACEDVRALVKLERKVPAIWHVEKRNNKGKVIAYLRELTPVQGVEVVGEEGDVIKMNAVFMRETNKSTGEVSEAIFFTTLPIARAPQRIVGYYDMRWNIENRCNRTLSQTWKVRTLVGRKFCAIYAQLMMVAMCYNACRIYEEKNPEEAEETYMKMRQRGMKSLLVSRSAVVFVPRLGVFAAMSTEKYADLSARRAVARVLALTEQGMSIGEAVSAYEKEKKPPGS